MEKSQGEGVWVSSGVIDNGYDNFSGGLTGKKRESEKRK